MGTFDQVSKIIGSNGATTAAVDLRGAKGAIAVEVLDASGNQVSSFGPGALVTAQFDCIKITSIDSSGNPLTIEYRIGGLLGALVATLTLTYDASGNLSSIVKS